MSTAAPEQDAPPDSLVVSEVFGRTFQGEGRSLGQLASFVRLGGCNLVCSWCDASYTWDASRHDLRAELNRTPVADIAAQLDAYDTPLVVLTGGEPLLHQRQPGWAALLDAIAARGRRIEVETNGTVSPDAVTLVMVDHFNVSPKLANSHIRVERRIRPDVLATFRDSGKADFKFVCRTADDVEVAAQLAGYFDIPRHLVWVMPEGQSPDILAEVSARIAPRALELGLNFTPRLHIHLWGNERGH